MNILYSFRTRGVGAESVHISGIANAFEELGHSVEFESPTGLDPRKGTGHSPYRESGKSSLLHRVVTKLPGPLFELAEIAYNHRARKRILQRLCKKQYDLIYERHAFFLEATSRLAASRDIPYVVEVNELVGDERVRKQPLLTPLCRRYDQRIFQQAKLVVTVSPHLRRKILEQYSIDENKVLVHPNAVESKILEKETDPKKFCYQYELEGRLVICFVGWFVPWHRLDLLVDAFSSLCANKPNLSPLLLLAGDGPLKKELKKQAMELGISENIVFTGSMPHEEIPNLLRASDISVIPHSNEYRSPIKLFEYMAQESAVIAPSTEPIASIISDGVNGLLFEPLNSTEFIEKLCLLATDVELRKCLGKNGRQTVEKHHTWTHNAREILARIA